MGFFAFYCGIVYNEFFSIPLSLFSTCYTKTYDKDPSTLTPSDYPSTFEYTRKSPDCVPSVGFDSVWFFTGEEVAFVNSFKMKLSIIIGVIHMCLGISMKGVNAFYFREPLNFIFEFIPQLIFMLVTFGYMCVAIIIKWNINWGDGSSAPSIISIFINLGAATKENGILWGDENGHMQTYYQQKFFLIAFICVFLMLIPKPLILSLQLTFFNKNKVKAKDLDEYEECKGEDMDLDKSEGLLMESEKDVHENDDHDHEHAEHGIGEIWVDQLIEIIEFVLGSVSNTASYLRLWALSLAHGQLAKVCYYL